MHTSRRIISVTLSGIGLQGKQREGRVSDNRLIYLERDTGLEPATFALARRRSTN
jgi:hypothetical protein